MVAPRLATSKAKWAAGFDMGASGDLVCPKMGLADFPTQVLEFAFQNSSLAGG
ncbi:hypothetical protein Maq22A_c23130 [Methylobacterium aquaticum]|uniref:Uncharacterized protein n=1 Tax=Methylobacterium aquaticum TaxID=270351 RepID=A0A0C6FWI7_9HYPH|nr:hypothetical protein Maq22A_c23130 [Methylobacterium aquaticum]